MNDAKCRPRTPWRLIGGARNDRVAEPPTREPDGGFDALDLDHGPERHARPLGAVDELPPHRVVSAVLGVVQDQWCLGERLDRDGLARAVVVATDDDELLQPRDPEVEPRVVDRQDDEPGLERGIAHLVGDLRRVEADEAEANVRVLAPEVRREVGDQVRRRCAEHAEAERAAAKVAHLGYGVPGTLDIGEHALGLGPEPAAGLGEHEAAAGACEERDPELALELSHLLRDRRLREVERARGSAERAVLDRGQEVRELLNRHIGKTLIKRR